MSSEGDFVVVDDVEVQGYNEAGLLPLSPDTQAKIQKWLAPTDYLSLGNEYMRHLHSHVNGTGDWLRNSPSFRQWRTSTDRGSIWIKGVPGSGKSVFAAATAKELADQEKAPVLFFFFRQIVATNHEPKYLVRDWLSQTLPHSPLLQAKLKEYLENDQKIDEIGLDTLWHELCTTLQTLPRVFCVADALDEMDDGNEAFIHQLVKLGTAHPSTIKVILTSRPISRIEAILRDPSIIPVRLDQTHIHPDIVKYVEIRLATLNPRLGPEKHELVKAAICERAQGLFLHARLMTDNLTEGLREGTIVEETLPTSLERLPRNLKELYNAMLAEHSARSGIPETIQLTLLQCVTHSARPLRLLELAIILGFIRKSSSLRDDKAMVRASCGRLLDILEDETVSVIHHTFTEFLLDSKRKEDPVGPAMPSFPVINSFDAHKVLALTCLQYIQACSWPNFEDTKSKHRHKSPAYHLEKAQLVEVKRTNALLTYATTSWPYHVSRADPDDQTIVQELDKFMLDGGDAFTSWIFLEYPKMKRFKVSPVHVAANVGLAEYMKHLASLGLPLDEGDGEKRTPLFVAAGSGHAAVVELLIKSGAELNSVDRQGCKPLHRAALMGHPSVIKLLLEAGVNPLEPKVHKSLDPHLALFRNSRESALLDACREGRAKTVRAFIPYLDPDSLEDALMWSAEFGDVEAVAAILDTCKVSVNVVKRNRTALHCAVRTMDPATIRVLLERGADPNGFCEGAAAGRIDKNSPFPYKSPIHELALHNYTSPVVSLSVREKTAECLRLLLNAGGDINSRTSDGTTPLHSAFTAPVLAANFKIELLLRHGADATAVTKAGDTPLHLARYATLETIEHMVRYGADLNARRPYDGRTPLHSMAIFRHQIPLEASLIQKFDLNIKDNQGDTFAHLMFATGFLSHDLIQALVNARADLNVRNNEGKAPIHMMRVYPKERGNDLFPELIAAGVDIHSKDGQGNSFFLNILSSESTPIEDVQLLIKNGCSIMTRNSKGATALHCVLQSWRAISLLDTLIAAGADPRWIDYAGNTLLHQAPLRFSTSHFESYIDILEAIVAYGIPPDVRNHMNQTPLHVACATCAPTGFFREGRRTSPLLHKTAINAADFSGATPLHYAAASSDEMVNIILGAGADITALTLRGLSALHIAARARLSDSVASLLSAYEREGKLGDFINLQDDNGQTPLHYACLSGRPETVCLLLQYGAGHSVKNIQGHTPLYVLGECSRENELWDIIKSNGYVARLNALGIPMKETFTIMDYRSRLISLPPAPPPPDLFPPPPPPAPSAEDSFPPPPPPPPPSEVYNDPELPRAYESLVMLIKAGANPMGPPRLYFTPMDVAVKWSCTEMVIEMNRRGFKSAAYQFKEHCLLAASKEAVKLVHEKPRTTLDRLNITFATYLYSHDPDLLAEYFQHDLDDKHKEFAIYTLITGGYWMFLKRFSSVAREVEDLSIAKGDPLPISLLNVACRRRLPNLEVIKVLVEDVGIDVNQYSPIKAKEARKHQYQLLAGSPLHQLAGGASFWHGEALEYLIKAGAKLETRNERGETLLMTAVQTGFRNGHIVEILLKLGADPNALGECGETSLRLANSIEVYRLLLQYGADPSLGSEPALISAIDLEDLEIFSLLLDSGVDVNLPHSVPENTTLDYYGNRVAPAIPPLHFAAVLGSGCHGDLPPCSMAMVERLLEHGADPFMRNEEGDTIIHIVLRARGAFEPFLELPNLDLEMRGHKGRTLLISACINSRPIPRIRRHNQAIYLPPPPDPTKDIEGLPHPAIALLDLGANPSATDDNGRTAMHWMCDDKNPFSKEMKDVLKSLIAKSPESIHKRDNDGLKPLHLAIRGTNAWVMETLLTAGADATEPHPTTGETALHMLAPQLVSAESYDIRWRYKLNEVEEVLKMWIDRFLELGVSINARDARGRTPLFSGLMAIESGDEFAHPLTALDYLLEKGADPGVTDDEFGGTLLHALAFQRLPQFAPKRKERMRELITCFRRLMELGVDPLTEDKLQRTAIDIAAVSGNDFLVEIFRGSGSGGGEIEDSEDEQPEYPREFWP